MKFWQNKKWTKAKKEALGRDDLVSLKKAIVSSEVEAKL